MISYSDVRLPCKRRANMSRLHCDAALNFRPSKIAPRRRQAVRIHLDNSAVISLINADIRRQLPARDHRGDGLHDGLRVGRNVLPRFPLRLHKTEFTAARYRRRTGAAIHDDDVISGADSYCTCASRIHRTNVRDHLYLYERK